MEIEYKGNQFKFSILYEKKIIDLRKSNWVINFVINF